MACFARDDLCVLVCCIRMPRTSQCTRLEATCQPLLRQSRKAPAGAQEDGAAPEPKEKGKKKQGSKSKAKAKK